jgi:hypothetical protein
MQIRSSTGLTGAVSSVAFCTLLACGGGGGNNARSLDPNTSQPSTVSTPIGTGGVGAASWNASPNEAGASGTGAAGANAKPPASTGGNGAAGMTAGASGSGGMAPITGTGGLGTTMMQPMTPFTGPLDGDPNKPMVAIDGIPCGVPTVGFGGPPPSVKITDRDVVVAYPCAHEGAAVTFFLFLHGTLDEPMKVTFTMNAWPIHKLVDSHNIIVVAPKAIGTQWGNGDDGKDLPHLYDVVDWVYKTFGEKFNIRSMWAQGGSWGAFYLATTFACDPKFESHLKGIQLIVGGGCPACTNRLSCMVAQQELQLGNNMQLTPDMREMVSSGAAIDTYATQHGCDAKMGPMDVGNTKEWVWPNCDPGWTHSYFLGPGQHADAWDPAAVLKATEDIKGTEL